jgi:hypothetical protein
VVVSFIELIKFSDSKKHNSRYRTTKDLSTDGRTDGHGETSIPPYNFVAGGIITNHVQLLVRFIVTTTYNILYSDI